MITNIKLKGLRIFKEYEINTNNSFVIFSGRNATGKTSILEAIYYISTAKSHRTNLIDEMINKDSDYFQIDIKSDKAYRAIYSKNIKSFLIDGNKYSKVSDYVGDLSAVMFSPSDLELINGSKALRRRFINLELSLIDKKYLHLLNTYNKLIKERNELFKQAKIDHVLLDIITNQVIEKALIICSKRKAFILKLNEYLKRISESLNIEQIELEYNPSYLNDINKAFKDKEAYDIISKATNVGPHRDDIIIKLDGLLASGFASEGQARMIAIALKLALRDLISDEKGVKPIMLLDDVFASLDNKRILNLVKYIKDGYQTFLTTTSIMEIKDDLLKEALVIMLKK